MQKLVKNVLLASALSLGVPLAFGQTMVEPPSRASNDLNPNGGVSEGSPAGPTAKSNRQRQKEFNDAARGTPYDMTARSSRYYPPYHGSSADPSTPYEGSRESNPSGPRP